MPPRWRCDRPARRESSGQLYSALHGAEDRLHVRDVLVERAPAGGRDSILGARDAAVERLVAGDVFCLLQLSRVDAQVAVRRLQQLLELEKRQSIVDGEGADDAQAQPFVD